MPNPTAGFTLIEVLVGLVLLEIAAAGALTVAVIAERQSRALRDGAAVDLARYNLVRATEAACRNNAVPLAVPLLLPASGPRPPLTVTLRCGP